MPQSWQMSLELVGSHHPHPEGHRRETEDRDPQANPADPSLDCPIVPGLSIRVDPEGSLEAHPDRLSRAAVLSG